MRIVSRVSEDLLISFLVNVVPSGFEVGAVEHEVVGEASLPDGEFGRDATGEATLDEIHRLRNGFANRG